MLSQDFNATQIMESLNDGIYATDFERKIIYWNAAAERITGWKREEILGRPCWDNILCHVDKQGHQLCMNTFCPLYRAIQTGKSSAAPILVFAQSRDGRRIPMQVSVAPLRDEQGRIIGGVESFRDMSETIRDSMRAMEIQSNAMSIAEPEDGRVRFRAHCIPFDIVGGDFHMIQRLGDDGFAIMLADVMGHGSPAALYTMHLRSIWEECREHLEDPEKFLSEVNVRLSRLTQDDRMFATAWFGALDAASGQLRFVNAGNPPFLAFHPGREPEIIEKSGTPLGMFPETEYEEIELSLTPGSRLLLYTDGATEIETAEGEPLQTTGFVQLLDRLQYVENDVSLERVAERLLNTSSALNLGDDMTLLEVLWSPE